MYENRFGRFTAVDPLLVSGKSANPQTFNRYAYTSNNPIIRVDRDGLDWFQFTDDKVRRDGTSVSVTTIYWDNRDPMNLSGRTRYEGPGVYREGNWGPNKRGWTALDPFEGRVSFCKTREDALNKYNEYLKEGRINATRGFTDAIASLSGPLSSIIYDWGADAIIGRPDQNSNVYTVTNRSTNALIIVGTTLGVPGLAGARGPGLANEANTIVATGQRHHLLTNKIMRALDKHGLLKGVFNREDARFIYNALDGAAHNGYQKWHREYDNLVVKWIRDNKDATAETFIKFLDDLHQQPWLKERIPNVKL